MAKGGWSRPLGSFVQEVEQELVGRQRTIVAEALTLVILGSPVDSGAFRGNHRVSIGSPDNGYDPSLGQRSPPRGGLEMETFDRESAKISALSVPFTVAYIQNNAPYAGKLENGSSQQAPEGVYETAANSLREKYGR
jgi:hypothetical protein